MSVRRRGDVKPTNGSANGTTNCSINNEHTPNLKTDHTRWRMKNVDGRQTWHYLESDEELKAWPMTSADKYYLGMDTGAQTLTKATTPLQAAENGLAFYSRLQLDPGNWGCEYGGPMFLLPGLVITLYSTDMRLSRPAELEIARYILSMQNLGSRNGGAGGWGLHTAGDSTVFGTSMNYTALRLLGISPEDPRMRKARSCLYEMGGAINGPHWAKFWLSVLGVMDWDVVNPVPPELWLLPDWTPISPWRWWIHMRQVYLPMGHVWSKKWTYPRADTDPLIKELRQELFTQPHAEIRWPRFRNAISPADNYNPKSWVLNMINWLLVMIYIPYLRIDWLIKRAEAWTWQLIQIEDKNTNYAGLAPVNSPMNLLCCFIEEGRDAESVKLHREHIHDFLWMSEGGMMMNGTDGVQTWDTAFTIQAVVAAGLAEDVKYRPMMEKALSFLESQQFTGHPHGYETSSTYSDPPTAKTSPEAGYRQARRGAWGFSTRSQGYTVSDCTSEALKAILELQALQTSTGTGKKIYPELMSFERLRWAADIILTMQNDTGGIASYEIRRGSERLEYLNAAEVFGRIMVEYDYPECTTSCVTAMHLFSEAFPEYRKNDIAIFQSRAVEWIRTNQRADGSWYGSWAICFTYAAMFALESLKLQGEVYENSERVRRACKFLVDHQNEDGGWGESFKSCETGEWHDHPDGSQVVNTAWTVVALLEAGYADRAVLDKAIKLLMQRQQSNGEWLQEGIEGVFNKSCMISYPNYKFIFPIKALGMFARRFGDPKVAYWASSKAEEVNDTLDIQV